MLAAAFFWGTSATLARHVFRDHHVPPLTVVELRLMLAAGLLAAWIGARRPALLRVERQDWSYFVVLGLLGVAAIQGSYYYSISVLGVGLAILIQYLAPSLIVAFDLLRGGRPGAHVIAAIPVAWMGTALLIGDVDRTAFHAQWWQWAISFSSAFTFAFYVLFSKRGLRRYPPETVLFYTFLIAGLLWTVVTPPWRIAAAGYGAGMWGLFLLLAMFSTLVPFACFYAGLRHMPAPEASVLATTEPVVATLSSAILLGEGLRPLQWLGALLVLTAAAYSSLRKKET